jgi:hypothetical protein
VAPSDDAAVRETLDFLGLSAVRAGQWMREIARTPSAAWHRAAILLIRVAAILDVVHASQNILFRPQAE